MQNEVHATEELLLDAFTEALRSLDPDIIVGFEVQKGSLGYLADRAAALERTSLLREVSRVPEVSALLLLLPAFFCRFSRLQGSLVGCCSARRVLCMVLSNLV